MPRGAHVHGRPSRYKFTFDARLASTMWRGRDRPQRRSGRREFTIQFQNHSNSNSNDKYLSRRVRLNRCDVCPSDGYRNRVRVRPAAMPMAGRPRTCPSTAGLPRAGPGGRAVTRRRAGKVHNFLVTKIAISVSFRFSGHHRPAAGWAPAAVGDPRRDWIDAGPGERRRRRRAAAAARRGVERYVSFRAHTSVKSPLRPLRSRVPI